MIKASLSLAAVIGFCLGCWIGGYLIVKSAFSKRELSSTYATCYDLRGYTSSGPYVNHRTAASNWLKAGTKVRIVGAQAGPGGIRKYVVRDTGSSLLDDGHLDLWAANGCEQFGKRNIKYKIGWSK